MTLPQDFANPGQGPDIRIGSDGLAQDEGWRLETPYFAEDGTVPDRRLTMAHEITPNIPPSGDSVLWIRRESTFDLPIG
jgi:hypothetical protein